MTRQLDHIVQVIFCGMSRQLPKQRLVDEKMHFVAVFGSLPVENTCYVIIFYICMMIHEFSVNLYFITTIILQLSFLSKYLQIFMKLIIFG